MNAADQDAHSKPGRPAAAGVVAVFVTAGAVSWATPDGNLIVTLVPALVAGLVVHSAAVWCVRRSKAK